MRRTCNAIDENVKEMSNDLFGICENVDAHAVSIKQLEQQINQLSTNVNPHKHDTLPSNSIKNLNNDGHCMTLTTRGGKPIVDPPMPSEVEINEVTNKDEFGVIR